MFALGTLKQSTAEIIGQTEIYKLSFKITNVLFLKPKEHKVWCLLITQI